MHVGVGAHVHTHYHKIALSLSHTHTPLLQTVLDEVSITLNKNSVPGDKSAVVPGGIRIGTPALTTRGLKEADFVKVADFIHRAVQVRGRVRVRLVGVGVGREGGRAA